MFQAHVTGGNVWKAGIAGVMSSSASVLGHAFGGVGGIGHELLRAGAHGVASGVGNVLQGGNFLNGFAAGAVSSVAGSALGAARVDNGIMVLSSMAVGGVTAWSTGGDFISGSMRGLAIGFFNHAMHGDGPQEKINYYTNEQGELMADMPTVTVVARAPSSSGFSFLDASLAVSTTTAGYYGSKLSSSTSTFGVWYSQGKLRHKLYTNGWKGNQYVKPFKVKNIGIGLKGFSYLGGLFTSAVSAEDLRLSQSVDQQAQNFLELSINVAGFTPVVGPPLTLYWNFGGRQLHYLWLDNVVLTQQKLGVLGLPSTMPFK